MTDEHPWVMVMEFPTKRDFVEAFNEAIDHNGLLISACRCDLDQVEIAALIAQGEAERRP